MCVCVRDRYKKGKQNGLREIEGERRERMRRLESERTSSEPLIRRVSLLRSTPTRVGQV